MCIRSCPVIYYIKYFFSHIKILYLINLHFFFFLQRRGFFFLLLFLWKCTFNVFQHIFMSTKAAASFCVGFSFLYYLILHELRCLLSITDTEFAIDSLLSAATHIVKFVLASFLYLFIS